MTPRAETLPEEVETALIGLVAVATTNAPMSIAEPALDALRTAILAHARRTREEAVEAAAKECDIHAHHYENQAALDKTELMTMVHKMQASACRTDARSIRDLGGALAPPVEGAPGSAGPVEGARGPGKEG